MRSKRIWIVLLIGVVPMLFGQARPVDIKETDMINVIPKPVEVSMDEGVFTWSCEGLAVVAPRKTESAARILQEQIVFFTNLPCVVTQERSIAAARGRIILELDQGLKTEQGGYRLKIEPERILITAADVQGLLHGGATLIQLLFEGSSPENSGGEIQCMSIHDRPRFSWRGMHLDVCRHYMPVEFIKKYLDIMALYKLNIFHWHLTEDQGWRIEIKKYPRLAEVAAWRTPIGFMHNQRIGLNHDNGSRYGGYYTQDQVREIVAYAKARGITVVPEIEMPGHSSAALAAYPNLGCTGGPYEVLTEAAVSRDIYCAGNEETFAFLTGVLTEVLELFDSEYIHIGGDEVPKHAWENCPKCQQRIREQGLENEEQLSRWFLSRIEDFLNERGRKLIGWDEILEGGLTENATVMSWRGFEGGIAAAKQGHDSVITPSRFTYFNFRQDEYPFGPGHPWNLALENVYSFEPVPAEVSSEDAKHILGAQGCLWTEYIPTAEHAEYLLLPRLCALSEVLWLDPAQKDFADFQRRLAVHTPMLDAMDVNYYIPVVEGFSRENVYIDSMQCALTNPGNTGDIYYAIEGDSQGARRYTGPIQIEADLTLKAWIDTGSHTSMVRVGHFKKQDYLPSVDVSNLAKGLTCRVYEGDFYACDQIESAALKAELVCSDFNNPVPDQDNLGLVYEGYFHAPRRGIYRFFTKSRHGSLLYIGGGKIVDNHGRHSAFEHCGPVALDEGYHPFRLEYFKRDLHFILGVSVESDSMQKQPLAPEMLFH